MDNKIREIFDAAGRGPIDDNRNRTVRNLNLLLTEGLITILLTPIGTVNIRKSNNFRYNVKISTSKFSRFIKIEGLITTYQLLGKVAKFLQDPQVRESMIESIQTPVKCMKCEGTGVLPMFFYYAEGVCFDCGGCGFTSKEYAVHLKPKVLTGQRFLNQFRNSAGSSYEIFPDGVKNLCLLAFDDHPTAKMYLAFKDGKYYIHQPICQSNTWYTVPESEIEKFAAESNWTSMILAAIKKQ